MQITEDLIEKICDDLKLALMDLNHNGPNDFDEARVNYELNVLTEISDALSNKED